MMPSSKHDPYQELEAYLRQAQAEVGRAVEDLLASESTGSSSSSAGSRKNSCPDLYSYAEADDPYRTPRKFVPAYTSLSAPRPRRDGSGGKVQRAADVLVAAAAANGSKKCAGDGEPPCVWDSYYGWESLHLSRPPSGDAHLLSVYTERLLEAVNGSFIDELSAADAADDDGDDELGTPAGPTTTAEPVPPPSRLLGDDVCDGAWNSESDAAAVSLLLERGGDLDSVDGGGGGGGESAEKSSPPVRSSSWPDLVALRRGSVLRRVCNRSGSYPQTTATRPKGGADAACLVDELDEDQTVSYDGSLYKNQQLYYESDGSCEDGPEEAAAGAVKDTKLVSVERFAEVELRISDSDHDEDEMRAGSEVSALPELFIREDERDPPSASPAQRSAAAAFDFSPAATAAAAALLLAAAAPTTTTPAVRDSFALDLRSPGLVRSRLNPYTIEVIASHVSSPDEVLATVSTLEARLASLPLPPLVIDENEPDTGTWSSTSTAHSASTVSRHELEEFLKGVEPPHEPPSWPQDAVTQTTPEISRSSSFTWVADYGEEDLGSSKESLVNVAGSVDTARCLAAAAQSPSPVSNSSSSSCDAPPTPLTPRASPSSQEVSSDLSDSAAHGATSTRAPPRSLLNNGASPSLPALDAREEGAPQPSTQRQLSLEEKPQVRSLSRPTAKAADKKAPEVVTSHPWTSPQQLSHKASSAPVLLKNRPPTSLGDTGQKCGLLHETSPASAGSTPEEEAKVREHVVFWPRRYFAKPSSRR